MGHGRSQADNTQSLGSGAVDEINNFISKTHSKHSATLRDLHQLNELNRAKVNALLPKNELFPTPAKQGATHELQSNDYKYSDNNSFDLAFSYKEYFHKDMQHLKKRFIDRVTPGYSQQADSNRRRPDGLSGSFLLKSGARQENGEVFVRASMTEDLSGFRPQSEQPPKQDRVHSEVQSRAGDWEAKIEAQKQSKSFQIDDKPNVVGSPSPIVMSRGFMSFKKKSVVQSGLGLSMEQAIKARRKPKSIAKSGIADIDEVEEEPTSHVTDQAPSMLLLSKTGGSSEPWRPSGDGPEREPNDKAEHGPGQGQAEDQGQPDMAIDQEDYRRYEESLNSFIESKQLDFGEIERGAQGAFAKQRDPLEIMEVNSSFERSQRRTSQGDGLRKELLTQSELAGKKEEFEAFLSNLKSEDSSHLDSKSFDFGKSKFK